MTWPPAPPPPPPPPPSLPPPGWYPDPVGPSTQRWWDGSRWTEHTGVPPAPAGAHQQLSTASGNVELAGWWRRFGGYVLDIIIVDVPSFVIGLLIGLATRGSAVSTPAGTHPSTATQVTVVLVTVVISLGYPYLMLRFRGQTVGMMAAGVLAVDRTSGVRITAAQAARRVLAFFFIVSLWLQIAAVIGFNHVGGPLPVGETLFRLLAFAALATTALWPLGNPANQTLQDKVAETAVVRTRV